MHWHDRIQRPMGYNDPGHAHELTFSCFHRIPFLTIDRFSKRLAEAIEQAVRELNFDLWAYVFMPDHVHLIVWPHNPDYDTSRLIQRIKEPVSRFAKTEMQRNTLPTLQPFLESNLPKHVWQPGRGYDRNITEPKTLAAAIEYIHLNPVRKKLVDRITNWKWSSASWYEGPPINNLQPAPIPPAWTTEN